MIRMGSWRLWSQKRCGGGSGGESVGGGSVGESVGGGSGGECGGCGVCLCGYIRRWVGVGGSVCCVGV